MEPFKVHILGCGSALPTLEHFASSQIVELREKYFMIDCGEGTQISLRRSHLRFTKIGHIFISHLHGDHCFGLIGLISTFGMLGRTAPLHVYAPKELETILTELIKMFCPDLSYKVEFHAVDTRQQKVVYEDRSVTVSSIPLRHRVPCCGYLFKEKEGRRHIRRDVTDFYGIPVSRLDAIKSGENWITQDGEVIPNDKLTLPADKPRSYAYCSDTCYLPNLHNLIEGVNLLYHESTYDNSCADRAKLYFHSTAAQAAMVARDAHAGKLLLGHYSARYDNEDILLQEARQIFPESYLSAEGMTVDVDKCK